MMLQEDDVVLCKVKKIEGTTVFLETEDGLCGTMVLSEVAAGRIRNLRNYVSLNKKIVCKVLKVAGEHIELSLRRVTAKEREHVLEENKKERALRSMVKIVGEDPDTIISKIKKEGDILDFLEEARENQKVFEKFVSKDKAEKLFKIVSEKEGRDKVVRGKFTLKSLSGSGLREIKEILGVENCEIHYLGSSLFSVSVSGKDFKEANAKLEEVLDEIKNRAEEGKLNFAVKGK